MSSGRDVSAGSEKDALAGGELGRRGFLQISGAAAAMAALGGCFTAPRDRALPYGHRPPEVTPGDSLHYATAVEEHGYGIGLVVESREGRPIKVDGNRRHPMSLGATGAREQGLLMQLYDPERTRAVAERGAASTWRAYRVAADGMAARQADARGERLRFLVGPSASPLLSSLRDRIQERFPRARIVAWDPLSRDAVHQGTRLAFGEPLEPRVRYEALRVLVALDADVLGEGPSRLADAYHLAEARRPDPEMVRIYAVEPSPSLTGMYGDHTLRLSSSAVGGFARALLRELAERHALPGLAFARGLGLAPDDERTARFARVIADDLVRAGSRGLVIAGPRQPPEVHALAWAIDAALGSLAAQVSMIRPPVREVETGLAGVAALAAELQAGAVDTLVVTAFDPVYSAPSAGLAEAMARAPGTVYLAQHADATAARAAWVLPRATVLEQWGDTRAADGTAAVIQPLIAPIFDGRTEAEVLAPFAGEAGFDPHAAVQALWRSRRAGPGFEREWESWLREGVVSGTAAPAVRTALDTGRIAAALAGAPRRAPAALEVQLRPSYTLGDGAFAWNPWLLEVPDPVTRQSWGNAALVSPDTAKALGISRGQPVRVSVGTRSLLLPTYPLPGQADGVVTVALGHGRGLDAAGANAYLLRAPEALWAVPAAVRPTSERVPLVLVQDHDTEDGRPIAISATVADLVREGPAFLAEHRGPVEKLYDPFDGEGRPYRWAMAIDLSRCIACAACVVACQAENNIPTVGAEQVARGREMHWLRIDRYFQGDPKEPRAVTQPLACVHCEAAPCEYVCPVNATVHSDEGVNEMIYNRCIGTRFCSNNCPYKVRRFNYEGWHEDEAPLVTLGRNPDVTVRAQGVMEKCTYCIQRIERSRIDASNRGEEIDTVHLQTACAQACPTRAIVFGSLHVEDAPVTRLHQDRRRYDLLHELGTRPRTAYLARIRNPNPEL